MSKAYKTSQESSVHLFSLTKVKLYISLIRSQLMYCSPIWYPKDINNLELASSETSYLMITFLIIKLDLLNLNFSINRNF